MGYRGDDLDLRTPQSHPTVDVGSWRDADNGARSRLHHGGVLNGPILVDETVLECCNHAYDVALAHGAVEVRLEHFLHALTRIDAAAEALEQRGARVASLRREIATVIASEIPVSSSRTSGSPRRTQELEDVLRLSAAHASRRNEPASIEDVLHVILDEEPDLPGLSLLTRRLHRRPSLDTLPSLSRSYGDSRNYLNEGRSRYRLAASQPAYGHENGNGNGNGRIDGLENAVNNLVGDIAADRKLLSSTLQDLHREAVNQRDELIDGFNALNQAVHTVRTQSVDLAPLNERVASIGRETGNKLQALEAFMERLQRHQPQVDLTSVNKRLEAIEDVVTARHEDHGAQIAERLSKIEQAITRADGGSQVADRLTKIEDIVGKSQVRSTEQHDGVLRELAQVSSRFSGALIPVAERVERQRAEFASLLQPVSERVDRQLPAFVERIDKQRGEIVAAILTPLAERITQLEKLSQSADGHEAKTSQALVAVNDRLSRLEGALAGWSKQATDTATVQAKELREIEDVLIKINDGQRVASGSLSAWRQEGTSVLSTILGRVETVEQQNARSAAMLDQLSLLVERMHQVTAQRYLKRNRIKYWLFGTDDWISASWPSQANRITEAMERVKSARV